MPSPGKGNVDCDLFAAARSNNIEAASAAIVIGANVNYRGGLFAERPLHVAAQKGFVDMSRLLIKNGANVNGLCQRRNTPLHEAVQVGNVNTVMILCENGSDPLLKNKMGATPLDLAKRKGGSPAAIDIMRYLKIGLSQKEPINESSPCVKKKSSKAPQTHQSIDTDDSNSYEGRASCGPTGHQKCFGRWYDGLRDEQGIVTWKAVQEEVQFAESLLSRLRPLQIQKRKGACHPSDILPILLPEMSPDRLCEVLPELNNKSLLQDPVGWVSVNFPTPTLLRAAWTACTNGTITRILSAKVKSLNAAISPVRLPQQSPSRSS